jgi:hypothetical protein
MADGIRRGSAPNFAPPVEEGMVIELEDDHGEVTQMEFLGLIIHDDHRYGIFFPVSEKTPALSSGEVVILEVIDLDEDGQPSEFDLVTDEHMLKEVYDDFREATKDIYRFE